MLAGLKQVGSSRYRDRSVGSTKFAHIGKFKNVKDLAEEFFFHWELFQTGVYSADISNLVSLSLWKSESDKYSKNIPFKHWYAF